MRRRSAKVVMVWHGHAAHLIVGDRCRFHLATEVGNYLVSTVGEYFPQAHERDQEKPEPIGAGEDSIYETLVFPLSKQRCTEPECDCRERVVKQWSEIDGRRWKLRGEAQRGHMEFVDKYARLSLPKLRHTRKPKPPPPPRSK